MGGDWVRVIVRFKARRTIVRGALLIAARGGCCGYRVINSSSRSLVVVGGARSIYRLARPPADPVSRRVYARHATVQTA